MKTTPYTLLFLILLPTASFAGTELDEATASSVQQLLAHAVEIAAGIIMVLGMWLTRKLSSWLNKKTGMETEALMSSWAEKGVNYATEQAHKYLKKNGDRMRGPEKLEHALMFGLMLAEENKFPQQAKEKLVSYIEAKLGQERAEQLAEAEALIREEEE